MKLLTTGIAHDFSMGEIIKCRKTWKINVIKEKEKGGWRKTHLEIADKIWASSSPPF
jgi:hypothetical protein